jgi:UDP-glucose 4-epimerase
VKWLITGGCGFIGTNLIRKLVAEREHSIRIIDNLSVGRREDLAAACRFSEGSAPPVGSQPLHPGVGGSLPELIVGDILDAQLALEVARGMDVIVHLAANTGVGPSVENPRADCRVNVMGTLNYLEAARYNDVRRFVFASSGAPVGECRPPIHEEVVPHPVSPYGASKLCGEAYCSAYHKTYGVETVALRFGNVYGPFSGHKSSVVARFIGQAMAGESLEVYGDGKQTRDFVHVNDLVAAIRMAASKQAVGGEVFQIATSTETAIVELLELLLPVLAQAGFPDIEVRYAAPRLGDVRRNFSDTSKARKMLGWQPVIELKEGLKQTVAWFLDKRTAKDRLG